MEQALFYLALFTLACVVVLVGALAYGTRQLRHLHDVAPPPEGELPALSIVIAARDEERGIEAALRSVLAQDYPGLEVVVVDDRSTDRTGAILERMAAEDPRLTVLHVTDLPPGWLGKTHALQVGCGAARGELLLFTDADVVMAPSVARRAAAYLLREGLDHLTIAPRVEMPGFLLQTFGVFFSILFTVFTRPWEARDPKKPAHIGIGAFNLVRAAPFRRIGGFEPIRMRPDDDVKLGKLVKKNGLRQDFLMGTGMISVEWYHSVREAVRGLRKNGFAGVDYRISVILFATVTQIVFFIFPFAAVFVTVGATLALYAAVVALLLFLFAGAAWQQRVPAWYGVGIPLAAILFIVVIWNATLYALRHQGIEWRGTHYPLDELKANEV